MKTEGVGMSLPRKQSRMLNPKRHAAKPGHSKAFLCTHSHLLWRFLDSYEIWTNREMYCVVTVTQRSSFSRNATPNSVTALRQCEMHASSPRLCSSTPWLWPNNRLSSRGLTQQSLSAPSSRADKTCLALSQAGKIWADTEPVTPFLSRCISGTSWASPSLRRARWRGAFLIPCANNRHIYTRQKLRCIYSWFWKPINK